MGLIDIMSGALFRLVPETVHVELRPMAPGETPMSASPRPLTPEDRLQILQDLRDKGLITEREYDATRKMILKEVGDIP